MSFMKVHGFGNVANDPKVRTMSNGGLMVTFAIVCNEFRNNEQETSSYSCCWFIHEKTEKHKKLIKGATVVIENGRWVARRQVKQDGGTDYYNDLVIDRASDLQFPPIGKRLDQQAQPRPNYTNVTPPSGGTEHLPVAPEYSPPPPAPQDQSPSQPPADDVPPPPPGGYTPPNPYTGT